MNTSKITTYIQVKAPTEIGEKLKVKNENDTKAEEKIIEDTVTISEDGRNKAAEKKEELERMAREKQELMRQLEDIRKQNEAAASAISIRLKCMTIAMRMMSGDEVPTEDQRYLSKNDPELFGRAIMMRLENNDPKKHKRLSEEEESTGGDEESNSPGTKIEQSNDGGTQAEISVEAE